MAEHFVQPVEHDAVLETEVVELAVEDGAVVGGEDLMAAGRIGCRFDGGRGLPAQLLIVAGIDDLATRVVAAFTPRLPPSPTAPG